jgi:1-deoxy-D-xylulose-5-phosphate synthase
MQRAYDQVVHDVALQNLHVVFCLDRAGMAGSDGPTHHGAFDIAYMRCIPNLVVCAPMNEQELRNMMYTGVYGHNGPFTIRYPRGEGVMPNWRTPLEQIPVGKGRMITDGDEVAILTIGHIGNYAVEAWKELQREGIYAAHFDMRFAKPLDEELLHDIFKRFDRIVTVEDGCILGGFGSAVVEFMAQNGYSAKVKMLGIPDKFIEHGSQDELFTECHYDKEAIKQAVVEFTNENKLVLDFA